MIQKIKFFQERDIEPQYYIHLIKALHYEYMKAGEIVMERGSVGDKFYIIL